MPKQSNKKKTPKDINQLAAFIVEQTTQKSDHELAIRLKSSPSTKKT